MLVQFSNILKIVKFIDLKFSTFFHETILNYTFSLQIKNCDFVYKFSK